MLMLFYSYFSFLKGHCNFENNAKCTWANQQGDDFDWILGQGSTPSRFTGPATDKTTGTDQGK